MCAFLEGVGGLGKCQTRGCFASLAVKCCESEGPPTRVNAVCLSSLRGGVNLEREKVFIAAGTFFGGGFVVVLLRSRQAGFLQL